MFGFGKALDLLRDGEAVARASWHEGFALVMVPGSTITVAADRPLGDAMPDLVGERVIYGAHLDLIDRRNPEQIAVLPVSLLSDDVLAEDWQRYRFMKRTKR